jgi:hypothetical protein
MGAEAVRHALCAVFEAQNLPLCGDQPLLAVADDEDLLPDGDDWMGVVVSGVVAPGWVSVYVADWPDSGLLARELSRRLAVPALEIWVAEDHHWGYAYFEDGLVRDRFADAPETVSATPDEAALYGGQPALLQPILQGSVSEAQTALQNAHAGAGQFAGASIDAFVPLLGLPFSHVYTSYDRFFDDDPEDYADDLEQVSEFRHYAFTLPPGREGLAE